MSERGWVGKGLRLPLLGVWGVPVPPLPVTGRSSPPVA